MLKSIGISDAHPLNAPTGTFPRRLFQTKTIYGLTPLSVQSQRFTEGLGEGAHNAPDQTALQKV